jgi:hypothetical protein
MSYSDPIYTISHHKLGHGECDKLAGEIEIGKVAIVSGNHTASAIYAIVGYT